MMEQCSTYKTNSLLQLIQDSKQKFKNVDQQNDCQEIKSKFNSSTFGRNNEHPISVQSRSPQINNMNSESNYISQRKLEQNIEQMKDINQIMQTQDEKIQIITNEYQNIQESYSKFQRDNDFRFKKVDEDIQNIIEKSYELISKLGVQDQKIKNCEEQIKTNKNDNNSQFSQLFKQQQEYNKKLAGLCEKVSLVIDNNSVFGIQNLDEKNNEIKMNFDSKLQYYLEDMKSKYKSFSDNIMQENLMRDEEVNKMKTQIAVIGNIEEDFVKTLSYLKELSDQISELKIDQNKQWQKIEELEIRNIRQNEEMEDLRLVVRKVHQRMKKQFE